MATQANTLPNNRRIRWCGVWCGVCFDKGELTLSTMPAPNSKERLCRPCWDRLRNLADIIPPGEIEALSHGMTP